jgi:hypothetical protein
MANKRYIASRLRAIHAEISKQQTRFSGVRHATDHPQTYPLF